MARNDRTYWNNPHLNDPGGIPKDATHEQVPRRQSGLSPFTGDAPLVSSRLEDGTHSPLLDLDYDVRLVPSTTPGHYHLYLDGISMPWWKYRIVLAVLGWAGVIQRGYAKWAIHRGQSFVRRPGVEKPAWASSSGTFPAPITADDEVLF